MPTPKLNLRDIFWLVAVVALVLVWWLERQKPAPAGAAPVGRWQLVVGKNGEQMMIDTTTGTTWDYQPHNDTWFKRSAPKGQPSAP